MEFFEVGGCVRDEIMGVKSKDIDFTVVLNSGDFPDPSLSVESVDPFTVMERELVRRGFKIFVRTPEFLTIRAKFPKPTAGMPTTIKPEWQGLDADFVLARKEGAYSDGRRPDEVTPGTLEDDLARRDFTMNAIAKDWEGNLIDPFGGQRDISIGIISAVGEADDRLREDALRAVRALRFMVTKNMTVDPGLRWAMQTQAVLDNIIGEPVKDERIAIEVQKMFRHDTLKSLRLMGEFPRLTEAIFSGKVFLDASMKTKVRK